MKPNFKRSVYLAAFTFLGVLLGVLIEILAELCYTKLLLTDFGRYSLGMSWSDFYQLRDFFAGFIMVVAGFLGYKAGKYWWHQIYELKKYSRWRKLKFKF